MFTYRLYGFVVSSDIEISHLVTCEEKTKEPDILIREGSIPGEILEKEADHKYEFGKEFSWLCNRTCRFTVENGNRITYSLKEGGRPDYLKNYLLGWGMSMLALQRGILAIHCSAVANDKGAVLICGESGAGKSTLTTAFLENGYRLMADDMAFVETREDGISYAAPAFPYQKLCRDAALSKSFSLDELIYIDEDKDKFFVPYRGEFRLDAVPVRGILMLGLVGGEQVISQDIRGLDSFKLVAENLFLRHLLGPKKYEPAIGQLCLKLAASVRMAYLGRPAQKNTTDEVIAKAFAWVGGLSDED